MDTGKGKCCIDAILGRYGFVIPNLTPEKVLDCFRESDYDRVVEMNSGHTIQMVQRFCERYHVKHWALDLDGNIIHRWLCKSKKYPVLVYIYANNHMYIIQDKAVIKSITNSHKEIKTCSNAMVQRGIKHMENVNEQMKNYAFECDTPWEEILDTNPETNVFYTMESLEPIIKYLYTECGVVPVNATTRNGNITRMKLKDDIYLYANPNVRTVMEACEGLDIDFTNQTLESLTLEFFKKTNPNHIKSSYNPETFNVFRRENTTVFRDTWGQPQGWAYFNERNDDGELAGGSIQMERCVAPQLAMVVGKYVNENVGKVVGVDIRSCYPNILKSFDVVFPLYCPLDEVEIYCGEALEVGFYFVETKNYMPCKGNGWYREFMVKELKEMGEEYTITHKLIPSRVYPQGYFNDFITALQKGGGVGKQNGKAVFGNSGEERQKEGINQVLYLSR